MAERDVTRAAPLKLEGDGERDDLGYCPFFQRTVELLGRRWTGSIVRVLMLGPHRFGEIRIAIPGLSDRLLSERLHELESEGLVLRETQDDAPLYRLTERGRDIQPAFEQIERYAHQWAEWEDPSGASD